MGNIKKLKSDIEALRVENARLLADEQRGFYPEYEVLQNEGERSQALDVLQQQLIGLLEAELAIAQPAADAMQQLHNIVMLNRKVVKVTYFSHLTSEEWWGDMCYAIQPSYKNIGLDNRVDYQAEQAIDQWYAEGIE